MKRTLLAIALFGLVSVTACADDDKPIHFSQLPQTAQQFIQQYFGNEKVALAKMESDFFGKNYDVIFASGNKVEFDSSGEWKEVKCKYSQVPQELIPSQIQKFIDETYPGTRVLTFERKRREYETKLSNGWELEFNKDFQLIDMDH